MPVCTENSLQHSAQPERAADLSSLPTRTLEILGRTGDLRPAGNTVRSKTVFPGDKVLSRAGFVALRACPRKNRQGINMRIFDRGLAGRVYLSGAGLPAPLLLGMF
jgi:hypothetical protein